jgi:hypothetical protein
MINPENNEDIPELRYPDKPEYSDFHDSADIYQALPAASKRDYD